MMDVYAMCVECIAHGVVWTSIRHQSGGWLFLIFTNQKANF